MSLLEPVLDDLQFQKDIVDEVRRRIVRYCPEWTEYNLSDPGITIAEMHAWMTEKLVYRLNQVPQKTYIRFLNLVGEDLLPAKEAKTELTFYFAAPFPINRDDPKAQNGETAIAADMEVATLPTEQTPEVVFSIDNTRIVNFPALHYLCRDDDAIKNYWTNTKDDVTKCGVNTQMKVFANPPKEGDAFYIGFDPNTDMRGYVLQMWFDCEDAGGGGVRRDNPPWEWSCWVKQDGVEKWQTVTLGSSPNERDTTGGLNNAQGKVVVYLPTHLHTSENAVYKGDNAYWLRCCYKRDPDDASQGEYHQQPTLKSIFAEVVGITLPATHARTVYNELLGVSDGEPGQTFVLQRSPVIAPDTDAPLFIDELERDSHGDAVYHRQWRQVENFANADAHDRVFVLDVRTGEVGFGPLVQQRNGAAKQYGHVPAPGRELRMQKYRYGGGRAGNVPARALNMLRQSIASVDRVVNLQQTEGGLDAEPVQESLLRLRREMWSRRAVTARDFEVLARQTKTVREVARARFVSPSDHTSTLGVADVRVVPALKPTDDGLIGLNQLQLGEEMRQAVQQHLDKHRLLTTILRVSEPTYVGVKVVVRLRAERNRRNAVLHDALHTLRLFLAPVNLLGDDFAEPTHSSFTPRFNSTGNTLKRDDPHARLREYLHGMAGDAERDAGRGWQGWPFGKALSVADLHVCLLNVPGVREVEDLSLMGCRFDVNHPPLPTNLADLGNRVALGLHEVICSLVGAGLDHEVTVVETP